MARTRTIHEQYSAKDAKDMIDLALLAVDHDGGNPVEICMTVPRGLTIALLLTALGAPASGQDLKPWKHGVIEPKGDAGFMVMVGQRDFASRHGLKIEIVPLKNG